jgi:hypothetical protein
VAVAGELLHGGLFPSWIGSGSVTVVRRCGQLWLLTRWWNGSGVMLGVRGSGDIVFLRYSCAMHLGHGVIADRDRSDIGFFSAVPVVAVEYVSLVVHLDPGLTTGLFGRVYGRDPGHRVLDPAHGVEPVLAVFGTDVVPLPSGAERYRVTVVSVRRRLCGEAARLRCRRLVHLAPEAVHIPQHLVRVNRDVLAGIFQVMAQMASGVGPPDSVGERGGGTRQFFHEQVVGLAVPRVGTMLARTGIGRWIRRWAGYLG